MHPHRNLRLLGATLALVVAWMHVMHPRLGLPRLVTYLQAGILFDPRPLLFTVSGLAIVVGIILVARGQYVKYVYLAGMALMVVYVLGFFAWHTVLQHGGLIWPHLPAHGHDPDVVRFVQIHLIEEPDQFLAKLLELLLLGVLVLLYRIDVLEAGVE